MNVKIHVHNDYRVEKKIELIKSWRVPDSTKKEIREFIDKAKLGQVNEGKMLTNATISKYLSTLRKTLEMINKPTSKITKGDIEKLDKKMVKKNLKSISNYRMDLKVFLKWKLGVEKEGKLSGWLDTKRKKKTPDYLKEQEVELLYKNSKNFSERFLIAVLFDTGARAEEFLNIRYEDIQLPSKNQNFVKIALKEEYSKTKGRTVSLYWKHSLEAVRGYLDERMKEGMSSNTPVFNRRYDALRMFLFRLGKKVLHKEIYPHLFRHSSATHYATKLNRQELCYRYGWRFSSDMPDVYISRAGMESKELDEKFKSTVLEDVQNKYDRLSQEFKELLDVVKPIINKKYNEKSH